MPKGSGSGSSEIGSDGVPITGPVNSLITRGLILSAIPGPTETAIGKKRIDQLQNAMDRRACNQNGGYYTLGGQCLVGEAAIAQVNKILNNPNAPDVIKAQAEAYLERNDENNDGIISSEEADKIANVEAAGAANVVDSVSNTGVVGTGDAGTSTGETTGTGEDTSTISDEDAISAAVKALPDKLKGIITEDNIMTVLKTVIDDPMTKIKKDMGAGVEIIFDQDWENWKVFGPLAIPGIPLPPGIIDVTLGDIADAVESVGGSISDFVNGILTKPDETLKDLGTTIVNKVKGVFEGTVDDPGFGGTLGTFKDWVLGTMGGGLGGLIFTTIEDQVSTIIDNSTTPIVPGGAEDEEEDILVDTTSAEEQFNNLLGTVTSLTDNNITPIEVGGADDDDDTNELGGRNQNEVIDKPPGGRTIIVDPRPSDPPDDDDDDDDTTEVGGRTFDDVTDKTPGGRTIIVDPRYPEPPDDIIIGGISQDPDPIEIGGPEPTPSGGGGGGGGGGGTGTADPFIRAVQYTPTVPLAIQQQAPVDYASGLMTAPAPVQPSGLMRPTNSMDAIGQLIFRNLA